MSGLFRGGMENLSSPMEGLRYMQNGGGGGGGGFTPASLTGLIGWWKADAGTNTTTNGGTLSSWNDQSGHTNNFGFNNASSTYDTTHAKNGLPVINNTGTSCGCITSGTFSIGGGSSFSCFMVLQIPVSTASGARLFGINVGGNDNTAGGGVFLLHPDRTSLLVQRNGASKSAAVSVLTGGNWAQVGTVFDGGNSNNICYFGNGSTGYTAGSTVSDTNGAFTSPATDFRVGISSSGGNNVEALYGEIVATNTALSSTDRAQLYSYFQTRWAVS